MKSSKIRPGFCLTQEKPDDNAHDQIIREVAFHQMIQRDLLDSEARCTLHNVLYIAARHGA